ncbi:hypothetical protein MHC_03765 [Mycoplasma haemocanis str. Illinois]|uniref:Lipoprotein n=1 Tax=Mycoplasma haemocanis (strain Illinois) TaxID=1111676 RepID=H6N7J1_MYCHN|nr:hypothetical protein [Mycoplasma haemocanis]AEW45613.1 hypothetical protein MHC_03765 [Mycoplasma haemocanis str. Illinois]
MSKSLLLLGSSVGAAGCAGVAGLAYWKSVTSGRTSLKDRFNNEVKGRVLLDASGTTHDSVWEELVKEYKAENVKIPFIKGLSKEDLNKDGLKSRCKEEANLTEEARFDSYVGWCSRNTLKTQFNDAVTGKTWNDSTVVGDWTSKKSGYAEDSNASLQVPDANGSGTIKKTNVTEQKIMDWCSSKSNSPFVNGSDADYKRAEALCTK